MRVLLQERSTEKSSLTKWPEDAERPEGSEEGIHAAT